MRTYLAAVVAASLLAPIAAGAQTIGSSPGSLSTEQATSIAQGWTALAARDLNRAADRVSAIFAAEPRSLQGLVLGVEVDLARAGAMAALDGYERWLGSAAVEEVFVVRRIARAVLMEATDSNATAPVRLAALLALSEDGDAAARRALDEAVTGGARGAATGLARRGNAEAVGRLLADLKGPVPNKMELIEALGRSGDARAIPVLVTLLDDPRPEHRAAAAEGLGNLGAREAASRIRPMLQPSGGSPMVRMAAASALLKLGDESGVEALRTWLQSQVPGMRVAAAQALASRIDDTWTNTVRGLAQEPDPLTRLDAARLLAAVDPALAQASFERLMADSDPVVRELAGQAAAETLPADVRRLRALLRGASALTRVHASARLLNLTR